MIGAYNRPMVLLAVFIAVAASYTALNLARRALASRLTPKRFWFTGASVTLAAGIWSMHFIAMLALRMPGMPMRFGIELTLLSLLIAGICTGAGFTVIGRKAPTSTSTVVAGAFMGLGVLAMHFIGMAAMKVEGTLHYAPQWVALSAVIAIVAATASLKLASRDRSNPAQVLAALFMGAAISGMHFVGMRAVVFHPARASSGILHGSGAGPTYLGLAVGICTVFILTVALAAAKIDAMLQSVGRRESRIALRLEVADALRNTAGPDALNAVAALMGRHFDVARTGYGQLDATANEITYNTCWTNGIVPPLTGRYPSSSFGDKIVQLLEQGETVVVSDLLEAEVSNEPITRETARYLDTRAILVVPFLQNGRLRSIVYLNDSKFRHWHQDEIAFMEELAERTRLVLERDEADQQLRDLNAVLEQRVRERTDQLREVERALFQSQKMEAVGQLAAGLAHDFNNVLAAVVGALEIITRKADDLNKVRRFADAGLQAAERGTRLTSQLLSFSRHQPVQLRLLAVCDVVMEMSELLRRTLGPMVALHFELSPVRLPVLADSSQIEMMLLNLAINARDAMPDGGRATIATRLIPTSGEVDLADGQYVELAVSDTGCGMDEEVRQRATEPFFTTKAVGKGTGLGLAQIYAMARRLGGAIRIESAVGIGTTVKVFIPLAEGILDSPETVQKQVNAKIEKSLSILVVDDDPDLREILARALEEEGHRVGLADGGRAALDYLQNDDVDVVILDFAMPEMNGAEVAAHIKASRPNQHIVFASGYADIEAIERALGDDPIFLRKPFKMNELLRVLDELQAC